MTWVLTWFNLKSCREAVTWVLFLVSPSFPARKRTDPSWSWRPAPPPPFRPWPRPTRPRSRSSFLWDWCLLLVVNRKGSLSAFGRNFRFRLAQKHFGRISLSAEKALTAEMLYFGRNTAISTEILLLFRPKEDTFGRNSPISAVSAFGRNWGFWIALFRFRPKLFRLTTIYFTMGIL